MLKKRGELALNNLTMLILVGISFLILVPASVMLANTVDYERERIVCLSSAIIRDKIFEVGRDLLYDLDCSTATFIVKKDEIVYEKLEDRNGKLEKTERKVKGYKEKEASSEIHTFIGDQLVSGWNSLGGGKLSAEGRFHGSEKQCLVISKISFDLEDSDFEFTKNDFVKHILENKIRNNNERMLIYDFLKSETGKSVFYIPDDFDKSKSNHVYVVYLASKEPNKHTGSKYSMFLGHGSDISKECDRFFS